MDLTVELGGKTYYPNNLGRPDRANNAERVIINDVKQGDEATITVSAYNLIQSSQQYSLVATGCFEGVVANRNFAGDQCSVFDCDDSESERRQTILMAILIPIAAIVFICCVMALCKRRKQGRNSEPTSKEAPASNAASPSVTAAGGKSTGSGAMGKEGSSAVDAGSSAV